MKASILVKALEEIKNGTSSIKYSFEERLTNTDMAIIAMNALKEYNDVLSDSGEEFYGPEKSNSDVASVASHSSTSGNPLEQCFVKTDININPLKEGRYIVTNGRGWFEVNWDEHYGFHEEFTDCSGLTHYLRPTKNNI